MWTYGVALVEARVGPGSFKRCLVSSVLYNEAFASSTVSVPALRPRTLKGAWASGSQLHRIGMPQHRAHSETTLMTK